ncbi:hypothetical protein Ob7_07060 [Thermosipho africanus Ob7]|uniref:O-antigen polymerase n=1 Tax=Thermosipho africanus TaxID=2421 RepID=UPI000E0A3B14|nr:O-antigen polymerase [Thermosipho africanus]RDI90811.1 hypothetical protein Ob7_07060 [Thermosipho africanus Ob7]
MSYLIILLIISYFVYSLDKYSKKIFSISVILILSQFTFSYVFYNSEINRKWIFIYDKPKMSWSFLIFFLLFIFGILWGYYFQEKVKFVFSFLPARSLKYSKFKLKLMYYFLAILSILAFSIAISGVNINFLVVSSRLYEQQFGRSTLINYLYFLNVVAIILSVYYRYLFQKRIKYSKIINILLIFISFFHGIKFTIFDTFLYPIIFSYVVNDDLKTIKDFITRYIIVLIFLFIAIVLFFIFVRGNGVAGIYNYFFSSVYNYFYNIETRPFQFVNPLRLFIPREFNLNFKFEIWGIYGYSLNDSYNTYTGFSMLYSIFNIFYPFIYFPYLLLLIKNFYLKKESGLLNSFLLTYLLYCNLMMFFSWQFTKSKYIYYIFVVFIIDIFSRKRNCIKSF